MTRQKQPRKNPHIILAQIIPCLFLFLLFTYPILHIYNLTGAQVQFFIFVRNYWAICSATALWFIVVNRLDITTLYENKLEGIKKAFTLARERLTPRTPANRPGFIYVFQRSDGIYKMGRTIDIDRRLHEHKAAYNADFKIIETFLVPHMGRYENLVLTMTEDYAWKEIGRTELRKMSNRQLQGFLDEFAEICEGDVAQ
jgi:predicted GIY-YIG superfamily endonuclease